MNLKRYEALKARVEKAKNAAAKAEGVIEQLTGELKEKFGVDTLKEGRKLLRKLLAKAEASETEFDLALASFEEKFGESLK